MVAGGGALSVEGFVVFLGGSTISASLCVLFCQLVYRRSTCVLFSAGHFSFQAGLSPSHKMISASTAGLWNAVFTQR